MKNSQRPLPVLFLIQHLDSGGTEDHFATLVRGIDRSRIQPHVFYVEGGRVSSELEHLGWLPVHHLDVRRAYDWSGFKAIRTVRRYLKRHAIGAVVNFHFMADFIGTLASLGRPVGVVSSRRDCGFTRTARQLRIGRWLDRHVDRYIAVSEAVRQAVSVAEHIDPSKIELIYNGADLAALDAQTWDLDAERRRLGISPQDLVVTCVANLNPVKDHLTLLDAFNRLLKRIPDKPLKLLLVGEGPMRETIEGRIAQLNLGHAVILAGSSPTPAREFQLADLCVLASETEGMSNSIVQAMAYRRPMVATAVGGNPETVVDDETGFLTPPKNPDALCDAMARLVENPELRRRMGSAARLRVERLFTQQRMLDEIQRVIFEVAARPALLDQPAASTAANS